MVRVTGYGQTGPYAPARRLRLDRRGDGRPALRHRRARPAAGPRRHLASATRSRRPSPPRHPGRPARPRAHRPRPGRRLGDLRGGAGDDGVADPRVGRRPATCASAPARSCRTSRRPTSTRPPTAEILIAANQDTVFRRLATVMGRPELADDPRYATHGARGANQAELDALIADWTATQPGARAARRAARRPACRPAASTAPPTCSPTRTSPPARRSCAVPAPRARRAADAERRAEAVRRPRARSAGPGPALGQHNDEVYGDAARPQRRRARRPRLGRGHLSMAGLDEDYAAAGFARRLGWGGGRRWC